MRTVQQAFQVATTPICQATSAAASILHYLDIPTLTEFFNHAWELKQGASALPGAGKRTIHGFKGEKQA
jgi:hypothetical protein